MTIKELEERTGMPRANIRFYEDEGLLCPTRLPNGYRDYSEEDVLTLERIALLRQLQVDINTIRLVQKGTLTLEQVLFGQRNRLEGDKVLIDRALEVCRRLEQSRVEYGALDAKYWLKELEQPQPPRQTAMPSPPPPPPPPAPTEEELYYWSHRAYEHPWMRYLARWFDYVIWRVLFLALFVLVFRWYGYLELGWLPDTLLTIGIYCVSILVEPFWLHYVGWTPGKALFGLKVRYKDGKKLTLEQARARAWRAAWQGDGLMIPFYSLWRNWKSYKCCRECEDCEWDVWLDTRYTCEPREKWYARVGQVAACLVPLALTGLILFSFLAPPHLNGLTVEEFSRNYNDRLEIYQRDYADRLTSKGVWSTGSYPIEGDYTLTTGDDEPIYVTGTVQWMDPEFTVENGAVTEVTFTVHSDRTLLSGLDYDREQFGFFAFTGAVEGLHFFNYKASDWETQWKELVRDCDLWGDFEAQCGDILVTQQVELSGYEQDRYGRLRAVDGEEPLFVRTITFSLGGSEAK